MAMDVHLRDLRYFLAVAQQLHFTRAAETLYVSQPALSKQIRALERQLRVSLFERDRGEVKLTRAGTELIPYAEQMLASWAVAKHALSKASDCTLVIGMHTSPGRGLLPQVRALMVANCPAVELELRHAPWSDRTAGLADGAADAAFVWLPMPQPPYRWVTIAREPRLVALPNDHRLAAEGSVSRRPRLGAGGTGLRPLEARARHERACCARRRARGRATRSDSSESCEFAIG